MSLGWVTDLLNRLAGRAARRAPATPPFELFIFDFDGTLADSHGWFLSVYPDVARHFGFRQLEPGLLDTLRGLPSREVLRRLRVPLWRLPAVSAHMDGLAREAPAHGLFAGVDQLIGDLKARGCLVAIVSSSCEAVVRKSLGPGLGGQVDHFGCSASLFGKAAKFRGAMRALGVSPARTLAIGDETRDMDAARKAGIACAAVSWGAATPEALDRVAPDFRPCCPEDLLQLAPT